jgi:1-phosphofructokinase family hexose kinase
VIVCVTLNPSVDRTMFVQGLKPNDTNRVLKTETDAGGKGINAARIIAEFGVETVATGFLAGATGKMVEHVLESENVRHEFVEVSGETRTNILIEDGSGRPPTTFNEPGPQPSPHEVQLLQEKLKDAAKSAGYVLFGGSVPPGLSPQTIAEFSRLIQQANPAVRIVVDADGELLKSAISEKPFMVKPNGDEAARLLNERVEDRDGALAASEKIHRMQIEIALVSMGSLGCAMCCDHGRYWAAAPKIEPKSTVGSGDSLLGAMIACLSQGMNAADALRWGVAAGAATAESDGASIGRKSEINRLVEKVKVEKVG